MLKETVVSYFGNIVEVARALEITHSAVCQWGEVIPEKNALIIQDITNGQLRYNKTFYRQGRRRAKHAA